MTDDTDRPAASRRRALQCMLWSGPGVLWTVAGGIPRSRLIGDATAAETAGPSFAQISDSRLGFANPPNPDLAGTLAEAMAAVRAQNVRCHAPRPHG